MSIITNIILCCSSDEDVRSLSRQINSFDSSKGCMLIHIDDNKLPEMWYGKKYFEANVFLGAINHLDLKAFLTYLKNNVEWDNPKWVQIFVKEEFDFNFCGHTHNKYGRFNKLGKNSCIVDLSVEGWNYEPVTINEIFGEHSKWIKSKKN